VDYQRIYEKMIRTDGRGEPNKARKNYSFVTASKTLPKLALSLGGKKKFLGYENKK